MTNLLNLTGHLLKGVLIGGIAALVGGFVLLGIVGVIAGYGLGGLLMGIYFGGLVIFYACPVGMFVGAFIATLRAVKKGEARLNIASILWLGVLLLVLAAVVYIPHRVIGEERQVTHAAMWVVNSEQHPDCEIPVAVLVLVEYNQYEEVCSVEFLAYLESEPGKILPITYNVTYDFGEVRGYHPVSVGTYKLEVMRGRGWIGGGSGCGREFSASCPRPRDDSLRSQYQMLQESSWAGESSGS